MEESKKSNLIIIGLIIVIVLIISQNVRFKREIENLKNRVSYMESNLNNGINNLNHSISNKVESLLNEQQNVVTNYTSTYNGIDTQKGIVKTLVEFMLKESNANSKVFLNVSTQNDTKGKDYECISTKGFNYSCDVELSYKDNYILNMYQKSEDGSFKKLNSYSYQYNVKSDFENRVKVMQRGVSTAKETTMYSFKLQNKTFGEESLKIKSIEVKAFYDNKEVYSEDVTNYNITNLKAIDEMNLSIASGNADSTETPEIDYSQISTDEKGNEYGSYRVQIFRSETNVEVDFPEYSFKTIVTFNNGDVHEY